MPVLSDRYSRYSALDWQHHSTRGGYGREHTKENRLGLNEALMFVAPDDELDEIGQHLSRNKIFVAFMCPVCWLAGAHE